MAGFQFVGNGPTGPVVNQGVTKLSGSVNKFEPQSSGFAEAASAIMKGLAIGAEKQKEQEARAGVVEALKKAGANEVTIARAAGGDWKQAANMYGAERREQSRYDRDRNDALTDEKRKITLEDEKREKLWREGNERSPFAGKTPQFYLDLGITTDPKQAAAFAASPKLGGAAFKSWLSAKQAAAGRESRADASLAIIDAREAAKRGNRMLDDLHKGTSSAQHTKQLYEMARQTLANGGAADVGVMSGANDLLNRGLAAIGMTDEATLAKMDNYAKFNMLANRLALLAKGEQGQPGYLSGAMSDKDIEFLTKQTINRDYTRSQNLAIIRAQEYMLDHAIAIGKLRDEVLNSPEVAGSPRKFAEVWSKKVREFNEQAGKTGFLAQAKLDVEITQRRGKLPDGTLERMTLEDKQKFLEKIKAQDAAAKKAKAGEQRERQRAKAAEVGKQRLTRQQRWDSAPIFEKGGPADRAYNYFFGK